MSFRYFGEEIKILSGDLSGEVPKNGTTCATGTTARSLTHQGFNLFGSLVAEIKLPELENSATMVMRFLPSDGWSLLLNDREWSAPMWHMFDNGYVEDAGYRMDVTYFRNKIIYTKDKSKLIDHQVDSYKVVVY